MPYNLNIPGQMLEAELQQIERLAPLVPPNGVIVEVGSLWGLSSWAWAKSADPSVRVYCIDPWTKNEGVRPIEERYGIRFGLPQFREYTRDCPNVVPMQGYSPRDFKDWSTPVDLYFEDSVHADPVFSSNIDFWTGHLKPTGIVCGHDYREKFPDIVKGVHALAERMNRKLHVVENLWYLLPDESLLDGGQ